MGVERIDTLVGLLGRYPLDRVSAIKFKVNLGIRCESPKLIERYARPEGRTFYVTNFMHGNVLKTGTVREKHFASDDPLQRGNHPLWVEMEVPCRKCTTCLKLRAARWRLRAIEEFKNSSRTWLCTYTLRPDQQSQAIWRARDRMAKRSICFEQSTADEQFREQVASISPAITKYLKRVRKVTSAPLRFIWIAERHDSGLPHFHALIHEQDEGRPVRKSVLKEQWGLGFSTFKLVEDARAAAYVCKYLSKDLATRVRSSLKYGVSPTPLGIAEGVRPDLPPVPLDGGELTLSEQRSVVRAFDLEETF